MKVIQDVEKQNNSYKGQRTTYYATAVQFFDYVHFFSSDEATFYENKKLGV